MLLDRPGQFLYRKGINTYWLMRLLVNNYRYFSMGMGLVILLLITWMLTGSQPSLVPWR